MLDRSTSFAIDAGSAAFFSTGLGSRLIDGLAALGVGNPREFLGGARCRVVLRHAAREAVFLVDAGTRHCVRFALDDLSGRERAHLNLHVAPEGRGRTAGSEAPGVRDAAISRFEIATLLSSAAVRLDGSPVSRLVARALRGISEGPPVDESEWNLLCALAANALSKDAAFRPDVEKLHLHVIAAVERRMPLGDPDEIENVLGALASLAESAAKSDNPSRFGDVLRLAPMILESIPRARDRTDFIASAGIFLDRGQFDSAAAVIERLVPVQVRHRVFEARRTATAAESAFVLRTAEAARDELETMIAGGSAIDLEFAHAATSRLIVRQELAFGDVGASIRSASRIVRSDAPHAARETGRAFGMIAVRLLGIAGTADARYELLAEFERRTDELIHSTARDAARTGFMEGVALDLRAGGTDENAARRCLDEMENRGPVAYLQLLTALDGLRAGARRPSDGFFTMAASFGPDPGAAVEWIDATDLLAGLETGAFPATFLVSAIARGADRTAYDDPFRDLRLVDAIRRLAAGGAVEEAAELVGLLQPESEPRLRGTVVVESVRSWIDGGRDVAERVTTLAELIRAVSYWQSVTGAHAEVRPESGGLEGSRVNEQVDPVRIDVERRETDLELTVIRYFDIAIGEAAAVSPALALGLLAVRDHEAGRTNLPSAGMVEAHLVSTLIRSLFRT